MARWGEVRVGVYMREMYLEVSRIVVVREASTSD